jgi:hypothetical protein
MFQSSCRDLELEKRRHKRSEESHGFALSIPKMVSSNIQAVKSAVAQTVRQYISKSVRQ